MTPDPSPPTPTSGPPPAPGSLHFAPTRTGGRLSWRNAPADAGVIGYRVLVNGNIVATTAWPSYRFRGLGCSTSFTVGVAAYNAAGTVSPTVTAPARTAACRATRLSTLGHEAARGAAFRKTIRLLRKQFVHDRSD